MLQQCKSAVVAALVGVLGALAPATSEAALTAYICNDAMCQGNDDLSLVDNDGDGIVGLWQVSYQEWWLSAVNFSWSKPTLSQGMDLFYAVASRRIGGTLWMYAVDTGFVGPATLSADVGGTNDNGGLARAGICAGVGIAPSNASNCSFSSVFGAGPYKETFGSIDALTNPYDALLGVMITVDRGGQIASGDLRLNVPEPASAALVGIGLLGLAAMRRRRTTR